MLRFNPYRPNSIVTAEMFQGRTDELRFITQSLYQTKYGNPQHFLIEGERGLGKSSLFLMVQQLAMGKHAIYTNQQLNFIVLSIELNASQSFFEILRSIASELQRTLAEKEKIKHLASEVWDFLKDWEILGLRYHKQNEDLLKPYEVLNEIVDCIEKLFLKASENFDGVLLLIDEADRPSETAGLGELVKLLTEKLTKKACDNVLIGMTGQPGLIAKLKASHESSSRIFTTLSLKPLSAEEMDAVVWNGLIAANRINEKQTEINADALAAIRELSEGYPHFLQEFAYKAFETDADGLITEEDVKSGALGSHGAMNQLGYKYFNEIYFSQIGSEDYRQVLHSMARFSDEWINREKIRKGFSFKESTLNNALIALKNRGIILSNPAIKGEFRLPTKSFAAWLKAMYTYEIEWSNPIPVYRAVSESNDKSE